MDLSLDDLLSGLQEAQQKKSTVRLSERNIVELVNKLKQLGFLGDELLHSANGRDYITRDRLKEEVTSALDTAGGRIPLVDLPSVIGVDLAHCERSASEVVSKSKNGSIFQAQGELFSVSYFDSLAMEVDESLQDSGMVAVGELAQRFALGAELLMTNLKPRMGKIIRGRLEGGVIYTDAYLARIKAQLRGALRGSLAPTSLATLRKELGLEGLSALAGLVPSLIEELLSEGAVTGKLAAGNSWVPAGFVKAQQDGVKSFYQQNGYMTYDMATKQGVSGGKQFFQSTFPDGVALSGVYLSPALVQQVEAAVEEAVQSGQWCDAQLSMPSMLSTTDAVELLATCKAATAGGAKLLAGTCVVSAPFLDGIKAKLVEEAAAAAREAHANRKKAAAGGGKQSQQPTESKPGAAAAAAGKGGKKGGNTSAPQFDASDDDDDWDMGKGKGGKKGKGGGKKGGKAPAAKQQPSSSSTAQTTQKTSQQGKRGNPTDDQLSASTAAVLHLDHLSQRILEHCPDAEGCGVDGLLSTAIAEEVRPAAVAEYERALAAIFTAGAEQRQKRRDLAVSKLESAHQKLQLFAHGISLFEADDQGTATALHRHLMRASGAECVDTLLQYLSTDSITDDVGEEVNAAVYQLVDVLPPSQRTGIINDLPSDVKPAVLSLVESMNGPNADDFIKTLETAAEASGLRLKKLDKKTETRLVGEHAKALQQQCIDAPDAATLLLVAVPCLLALCCGRAANLPGKSLAAGIERLKDGLSEENHAVLTEFHAGVVDKLKAAGDEISNTEKLEELAGKVRALVQQTTGPTKQT